MRQLADIRGQWRRLESGVEARGVSKELIDDVWLARELFVHHESENSHHGGTAVVEFNGTLLELDLVVHASPARGEAIAEVTLEFGLSLEVLHDEKLQVANESNNLKQSVHRDVRQSSKASLDGSKAGSGVVNISAQTDSGGSGDVSQHSQHSDTSVLQLNITETVESGLVLLVNQVQWVPESKRLLGSELTIEGVQRSGSGDLLLRSESSGNASNESKDTSDLHCSV